MIALHSFDGGTTEAMIADARGMLSPAVRTLGNHFRCSTSALAPGSRQAEEFEARHLTRAGSLDGDREHLCRALASYNQAGTGGRDAEWPLPLDEVIERLRTEWYANGNKFWNGSSRFLRKIYYLLRPAMRPSLRQKVQAFRIRNWKSLPFPSWPVDTTVEDLHERLLLDAMEAKGVSRIPFVWFWPAGARSCVVMTHDVETKAGMDSCQTLMDLDDSFGMKACFNIVPKGRYALPEGFLERIRERQFEVGVQDYNHDGRLYQNREEFLRRAGFINRFATKHQIAGFRAAVLYRRPEWLAELRFSYDMSVPNVAHLDPQRGGCCTVMPYFIGDMLELPVTTTQDYSLFRLLGEHSIELWKTQIKRIVEKNGMASFVVHPDYLLDRGDRSVYEELLKHLRIMREEGQTWFALPGQIDCWWRARNQMFVETVGNSNRVVGEGSERAVLAYAVRRNGKLSYELAGSDENYLRAGWGLEFT